MGAEMLHRWANIVLQFDSFRYIFLSSGNAIAIETAQHELGTPSSAAVVTQSVLSKEGGKCHVVFFSGMAPL